LLTPPVSANAFIFTAGGHEGWAAQSRISGTSSPPEAGRLPAASIP